MTPTVWKKRPIDVFKMLDLGSGGMWKNFRANPGDERSWRVLQCNKHVDCGKLLRIVLHKSEGLRASSMWSILVLTLKMSKTTKERVNSVLADPGNAPWNAPAAA